MKCELFGKENILYFQMRCHGFFFVAVFCLAGCIAFAEELAAEKQITLEDLEGTDVGSDFTNPDSLERPKRTLLLKKKLLGLGALGLGVGFGVGAVKG